MRSLISRQTTREQIENLQQFYEMKLLMNRSWSCVRVKDMRYIWSDIIFGVALACTALRSVSLTWDDTRVAEFSLFACHNILSHYGVCTIRIVRRVCDEANTHTPNRTQPMYWGCFLQSFPIQLLVTFERDFVGCMSFSAPLRRSRSDVADSTATALRVNHKASSLKAIYPIGEW